MRAILKGRMYRNTSDSSKLFQVTGIKKNVVEGVILSEKKSKKNTETLIKGKHKYSMSTLQGGAWKLV